MVKHAFSLRDGIDATYPKSHFTENNEIIQIYGVYRYKLNHLRTDFGHQIKPDPDKKPHSKNYSSRRFPLWLVIFEKITLCFCLYSLSINLHCIINTFSATEFFFFLEDILELIQDNLFPISSAPLSVPDCKRS